VGSAEGGIGVDGCGVKVAVGSEVATGESCTAESAEEAGVVEEAGIVEDIGPVRAQAARSVVRHNITKPDRSFLMRDSLDLD